ncbi:MAG: hypothetical protein U0T77_12000 [Chitinophagales bacterium]
MRTVWDATPRLLNLTVNPKSTSSVAQTICDGQSVTVGGQTFTTTQVNRQIVLANANGLGCGYDYAELNRKSVYFSVLKRCDGRV